MITVSRIKVQREPQKGFTLAELLIALLVFAMVSAAGVFSLQLGVQARSQLGEADDRIRTFEVMRAIIKDDLALIAPRRVRSEFGDLGLAPFIGGRGFDVRPPVDGERPLMGFVRRNWANPEGAAPRSTLQYVEYLEINNALVRRIRPYLDDARGQPKTDRILLSNFESLDVDFYEQETSIGLQWTNLWPQPVRTSFAPLAIRVRMRNERFGDIEQLFWIGEISG